MKKIISLILAVTMSICIFISTDIVVNGITTNTSGSFKYTVSEEGTATITDYTGKATVLQIPSTLNNHIVTAIGHYAFSRCTSLVDVVLSNGITTIGDGAFSRCESLTNITIPNGVTSIGSSAFYQCESLTSITLPNSVTSIGSSAFYQCKGLTSITISNSVTYIGSLTYFECTNLTSVTIPPSVTTIEHSAFTNCASLENVYITDIKAWCNIDFVNSHSNPLYFAENLYLNKKLVTSLVLPDGTANINKYAFYGYKKLSSVTIPDSVTNIGSFAFADTELTTVAIPDSVTGVGDFAFAYCQYLTNVILSKNLTRINSCLFYDCQNLQDIYIPIKIANIGKDAFYNCKKLERIDIFNSNCSIYNSQDTIDSATTIGCRPDSPAYTYAKENGKKYELIDNPYHLWEEYKIIQRATCTKDEIIEYSCTICDSVKQVTQKAKGHDILISKAVAATCTKEGKTESKKCSVCKKVIVAQKTIPKLGHKNQETIVQYIATGEKYTIKCKDCNKIISTDVTYYLSTPTFTAKSESKTIIVNYTKVKKAKGYQVRYRKGNTIVTITYNSSKSAQKTLGKIKKGTYKVYVRAFTTRNDSKVYSLWSKAKTVKVN